MAPIEPVPSPYTPGSTAVFTPGRERERAAFDRILVDVAGSGRFHGRVQVLQGARGVGKTSLLRAAERTARRLGLATVFVTATQTEGLSLVAQELRGVMTHLAPRSVTDRFAASVSKIGVKLGPAEVAVDLQRAQPPDSAVAHLKSVLTAVARTTEKANRGLVLFVDEMQDVPRPDIRTLSTAWQELDAEAKRDGAPPIPAAMMTAGLSNTQEAITAGASFGERFRFTRLGNLDVPAAAQAVVEPVLESGVGWEPDAVDALVERSAGYPYFIQLYAHETWEVRERRPGDRVGVADVQAGIDAAAEQIETLYRGRWNRATPAERRILVAIAEGGREELTRGEIADRLGVKGGDLGMARASLLGKGLLAVPRHGVLAFNAPGFGDFILDEIDG
ncbi:ATP-binding protein [Agilicoccus flavus]|uniref:ATP-binding protein n=1 Tax=Agilicoccus flavus TaxID=2775968 RepID=UPI001CF6A19E|nr:ATP-binding protein [Agilicoccus flavus]